MNEGPGGLRYVAPVFRVKDLTRSLAFYSERLGFAVEFVHADFYAEVCRDGCHIHLKCAPAAPRDQAAFERDEHIDACLVVQDAEALAASFASAGATVSVALRRMPYGREFHVRDPDGHILAFVQPAAK